MNLYTDKKQKNKSQSVAAVSQNKSDNKSTFQFVDNRPEAAAQRKLQEMAHNYPQEKQAAQLQAMADSYSAQQQNPIQKKASPEPSRRENNTGLPDNLKTGMENLSGMSLDDVKVHRNSDKPAQLQAHAYAQGTDIHVGPGQEKHLPHEAWHVVQQKQGRVKPTMQMKGKVNVNDDAGLEKEADVMGAKATQLKNHSTSGIASTTVSNEKSKGVIQRAVQVVGVPQTVADVTAHFLGTPNALTPAHIQILQTWSDSGTLHNFRPSQGRSGWDKVPLALARAHAMPTNVPPLFTAANLQFITQSGDRLATYYFSDGGQTGRLRQQHKSGPLAEVDPQVNTRISFANVDDRTAFVTALRNSRANGTVFADPNHALWNVPAVGQHLLEYHLTGGGVAVGWHPSGGLIENVPVAQNNDDAIAAIYNNILGVEDIADPGGGLFGCCFITTACMVSKGLPDDCTELETLRDFRDNYLLNREHGQDLFNFYYTYSPSIVEGINSQPDAIEIYEYLYTVIQSCVGSIRRKDLEEAFLIYVKMVLMLRDRYSPETEIPHKLNTILQSSLQ